MRCGVSLCLLCHVLAAPLLSFGWIGTGSRVASGEDGWETVLGSIVLGQGEGGRQRWLLEILSLNGLLCVGLADERLRSNALLGTRSNGRWHAWGWELGPRGSVEAVSSSAAPETGRPAPCHLVPQGQRVILVLHLIRMGSRMHLELAAMILSSSWHWHRLGAHSFMTPTHYQDAHVSVNSTMSNVENEDAVHDCVNFRPAVSTDIGATVRVLASDAFSSTAWITSCAQSSQSETFCGHCFRDAFRAKVLCETWTDRKFHGKLTTPPTMRRTKPKITVCMIRDDSALLNICVLSSHGCGGRFCRT
ncbi:unnamed protein product [Symbiodinium sp. CCMP2592]|nr:unnamed protein product [Symbiodinium sp. CCMP2592]